MKGSVITEFKVGVFVTAGLVLAMVIIFMVGSEHQFLTRQYTLYTNFEDIAGLRAGAPVQLAGLKVGFVNNIHISSDLEKKKITVAMRIQKEFQDRIRADSEATIETQGLLGDKFIYVSMGSESEPELKDGDTIKAKEMVSMLTLAKKAGEIMDDVNDAVKSIKELTEQAEEGEGLVHALFFDPEGEQVVHNLARATKAMGDVFAQVDEEGTGGIVTNLQHASADLRALMSSIRRGEGTLGKLITDPSLYDDLRALVGKANRNVLLRAVVRSTIQENESQMLK